MQKHHHFAYQMKYILAKTLVAKTLVCYNPRLKQAELKKLTRLGMEWNWCVSRSVGYVGGIRNIAYFTSNQLLHLCVYPCLCSCNGSRDCWPAQQLLLQPIPVNLHNHSQGRTDKPHLLADMYMYACDYHTAHVPTVTDIPPHMCMSSSHMCMSCVCGFPPWCTCANPTSVNLGPTL